MDSQDYKNWIISLNSDNFSTYIKVWFAYLASIHELILSSLKEEDKDAFVSNRQGDSIYLKTYKKDIAPKIIIEETTRNAIIRCYKKSKQIIKENFPEFFHVTYYKKIQPIDVFTKEPINISNDFYKFDVKIKNNDLEIGLLLVKNNKGQIPLQKKLNKIYYSAVVPLDVKGKNLWMINDNNKFRRFVFDNCMSQFEKNIVAKTKTKLHKEILGKFRDVFIIIVYNKCANLQQKIYKKISQIIQQIKK